MSNLIEFLTFSCISKWKTWDDLGFQIFTRMEEPNADEKEPMGFHISTTIELCLSKRACRQILGQVMDLNYLA